MFRRLPSSLPKEPVFKADLDQLGYFINERDQIRYKKRPELDFIYHIDKNDRINVLQKEAMNACIRDIVRDRLEKLGLIKLRVPFWALPSEPQLPILLSPNIKTKSRVILFFNEPCQDLGILAYRTIGTRSIKQGSIEEFVAGVFDGMSNASGNAEVPGVLIANPGQLLWHRGGQRPLTLSSWQGLPRKTAVHDAMRLDPVKNRIPGNESLEKHVAYVFERVLDSVTNAQAQIDVIALEWSADAIVKYLNTNWSKVSSRISTLILGAPQHNPPDILSPDGHSTPFTDFMSTRTRAYLNSSEDLGTAVVGRQQFGCNCYSSGSPIYSERIMEESWRSMLNWLALVHSVDNFAETEILIEEEPPNLEDEAPDTNAWEEGDKNTDVRASPK